MTGFFKFYVHISSPFTYLVAALPRPTYLSTYVSLKHRQQAIPGVAPIWHSRHSDPVCPFLDPPPLRSMAAHSTYSDFDAVDSNFPVWPISSKRRFSHSVSRWHQLGLLPPIGYSSSVELEVANSFTNFAIGATSPTISFTISPATLTVGLPCHLAWRSLLTPHMVPPSRGFCCSTACESSRTSGSKWSKDHQMWSQWAQVSESPPRNQAPLPPPFLRSYQSLQLICRWSQRCRWLLLRGQPAHLEHTCWKLYPIARLESHSQHCSLQCWFP